MTANTCTLTGSGSVSGELAFKTNLFKVIDIDTKLKASAGLEVSGNQSLDSLKLNLNHTDSPQVTLSNNVTASMKISLLGQASATLNLTANDIDDGEIKFGVSDLKINALDGNYGRLALLATAIVASPILHYTETGSKIDGTFSFTALEAGTENANVTVNLNNVDAKSNFEVDIKCKAKFVLSEGTAIRGSASIKVDGNVYEMEEAKVKWDAEVMFEATGVSAGIKVSSKAGTYKNHFNVFAQPTTTHHPGIDRRDFRGRAARSRQDAASRSHRRNPFGRPRPGAIRSRCATSNGRSRAWSSASWTWTAPLPWRIARSTPVCRR